MKCLPLQLLMMALMVGCTSGSEYDHRNKDIFDEAKTIARPEFYLGTLDFDGGIAALRTDIATIAQKTGDTTNNSAVVNNISNVTDLSVGNMIMGSGTQIQIGTVASIGVNQITMTRNATANGTGIPLVIERTYSGTNATIEGIVAIPQGYGVSFGTNGCTVSNGVFSQSFVILDSNGGILIAYGLEPPLQDASLSSSMKHILKARNSGLASIGDRVRLTATRVMNYGSGANVIPVVTDFSNLVIVSRNNRIPYSNVNAAFVRSTDLFRMRRVEGYVTSSPISAECDSGQAREFQFDYQTGYKGIICVGATSPTDAASCTGAKYPIGFQMSRNLGAGTLSGFDTGDMFSYTIAKDAKVRLTGPVFSPEYNQPDSNLLIMLSQKLQVETLR